MPTLKKKKIFPLLILLSVSFVLVVSEIEYRLSRYNKGVWGRPSPTFGGCSVTLDIADVKGSAEGTLAPSLAENSARGQSPSAYFVFAEEPQELSVLQREARWYRQEGWQLQSVGNIDGALSLYQKAIKLDPGYAVAYNDLGVIYETKGMTEEAEELYLKASKLDPDYPSVYANLAALYENKRDLEKAAFYWAKRAKMGLPGDPWTQKAEKRLQDLTQVIPQLRRGFLEQESLRLNKEIVERKTKEAEERLKLAKKLYTSADYAKAIEEVKQALSLNPQAEGALSLLDNAKNKLREEEKKAALEKMQAYFQDGVRYYQQDNLQAAKQEFEKLRELTTTPQREY